VVVVFLVWPAVLAKLSQLVAESDCAGITHVQEKMIAVIHWNTCRMKYTARSSDLY
jgi:hypothetical protein